MLKESSIQGWVLGSLGILALSLTLNGCSPERRAILRLTALNFQTQATEAIAATKVIYQLTANARPENQRREVLVRRLLTDPNLDFGNPEAINKIIGQILFQCLRDLKVDLVCSNSLLNGRHSKYSEGGYEGYDLVVVPLSK